MKRIFLTLFCLVVLCGTSHARMLQGVMGSGTTLNECSYAVGYDFAYTGDQASGDAYACIGGVATNGTQSGSGVITASGHSGNGVQIDANGEYLSFNLSKSWLEVEGTMWLKFTTTTGDNTILEAYGDADDYFYMRVASSNVIYARFNRSGNTIAFATTAVVPDNTWFLLEFKIDNDGALCGTAGQEMAIRIDANGNGVFDAGENWECESSGVEVSAMGTAPATLRLGVGQASTSRTNTYYIDDVYIKFN